ncbi:hypothetical protein M199_gp257 [Halogranum tailed virus 1]|uniref:Uncharacterized protein n=1 Tax=Halogranum tailed virus 1 TaxID=1273749 RepID=R4T6U9_9CAUD|nr:hypothetical protein M199_gp257 [Halogranum tailed virus 1]AGM11409.1 hypothetical protein HGTV1_111 [Halogranum tailed virus 1]
MPDEEYSAHRCDECGADLCQQSGEWFCPDCQETFQLVPDREEFIV